MWWKILISLAVIAISSGLAGADCPPADQNGDFIVTFEDFGIFARQWLQEGTIRYSDLRRNHIAAMQDEMSTASIDASNGNEFMPVAFLDFSGVYIDQNRKNIMIRNGMIYSSNDLRSPTTFYKGFLNGISGTGDNSYVQVINVSVKNSRENGIYISGSGIVKNCIVENNGNSSDNTVYGIGCGAYSTIADNKVTGTGNSAYGLVRAVYTSHGSIVKGNVISDNGTNAGVVRVGGTPQDVYGIKTYEACKIVNNTLYNNGFSTGGEINVIDVGHCCTIAENTMYLNGKQASGVVRGIRTGSGCNVVNNTAYENGYEAQDNVLGLNVGGGSTVSGNTVCRNGFTAIGDVSGIYVSSGVNVIGNTVTHNGVGAGGACYGVILTGGNLFDQNTLFSNFGTELDAPPIGWTPGTNHIP